MAGPQSAGEHNFHTHFVLMFPTPEGDFWHLSCKKWKMKAAAVMGNIRHEGSLWLFLFLFHLVWGFPTKYLHNHSSLQPPHPLPRATENHNCEGFWTQHKSRWFHWLSQTDLTVSSNPQVFAYTVNIFFSVWVLNLCLLSLYLYFTRFITPSLIQTLPSSHIHCPFLPLCSCRPPCWGALLVSLCE